MSQSRWPTRRIGDLGMVQAGRQRAPYFTSGAQHPYLRVANVFDGFIKADDVLTMPFTESELDTYRLAAGDILLNEGQSLDLVGRSAIYRGEPPNCCFQNTLIRFRAGSALSPEFAHIAFQNLYYSGVFSRTALKTTTIAHLGVKRFASLLVPVPPPEVQQRIVATVEALSRVISIVEDLTALKRQFNRTLRTALVLGPGVRPNGVRELFATGPWNKVSISEICEEVSERPTLSADLAVLSCTKSRGLVDSKEYFGRTVHSKDTSNYKVVRKGWFAYATNHLEEGSIGLLLHRDAGLVSPMYTVFRVKGYALATFLFAIFKTETYRRLFAKHTNTSVNRRGGIRWAEFSRLPVFLPDKSDQEAALSTLLRCDADLLAFERYQSALIRLRKGLISYLLAGNAPLKDD